MLHSMVHQHQEQLALEEIPSPINAQIFDFCESDLFPETLQNSEVASTSNCCYEEHPTYPTNLSLTPDMNKHTDNSVIKEDEPPETATTIQALTSAVTPTTTTANNNSNLSVTFDSPSDMENNISASIDFRNSTAYNIPQYLHNQQGQFDYTSLNTRNSVTDTADGSLTHYPADPPVVPLMAPPMPHVYEEECLSTMPHYMDNSSPSCSLLDSIIGPHLQGNLNPALAAESPGILPGGCLLLGTELPPQELDFQGENGGIFCPDTMPRVYNYNAELQTISNENQHFVNGAGNCTPLATEITSLEDPALKVGKLSVEERREKIHRYMKKRNERNFSKKIKYACRKTLADSRPRVRGRFAKNDELEMNRTACSISNQEEDTDEDVALKDEDDMIDSSDIFAHISGVSSFKCNNPLQSWT